MRTTFLSLCFGAAACIATIAIATEDTPQPTAVGKQIEDFQLQDFRGKPHRLSDFQKSKIVVVAFVGTECPLVKLYAQRLGEMHEQYGPAGVALMGLTSFLF